MKTDTTLNKQDPRHYKAGRVVIFRSKVAGGFNPGEKWIIRQGAESYAANGYFIMQNGKEFSQLDIQSKGQWNICDVEDQQTL